MFMRTSIKADDGRNIPIMTMGPICIKDEYKRKGYGKILLDYSLKKAAELGCGAVCFEEGVTLEYIRLTKDFEGIKEYVQHKGNTLTGYKQTKEKVSVRIEDILYFETVDGRVFAYTVECVYEIKGRLYQVEEKINKRNICRASKTMLVNVEHIISVRTALNGRLYARMENGEEILITRRYAKEVEDCFMEDEDDERI